MQRRRPTRTSFLIQNVSHLCRTAFDQRMKPWNITQSQFWVLLFISHYGEDGMTQTALAELLGIGGPSLGGLIDRLEKRGFVRRDPDFRDRRAQHAMLTRNGQAQLRKIQRVSVEMNMKIMKGLHRSQQYVLADALDTMKNNLVAMGMVQPSKRRPVPFAAVGRLADRRRGAQNR